MGVTCQILLKKTKDVYIPGDSVEGTIQYAIDTPMEFISITLSIKSKELIFSEPITSKTVYTETENFIDQRMDLEQAKEGETVALKAGCYEKLFCFVLPEDILSSYEDIQICFTSFFFQVEFVKPKPFSVPQIFYLDIELEIGIRPRPTVKYRTYEVKKEFNVMFSKKTVSLLTGILTPVYRGDEIQVFLEIYNPDKVPLVFLKIDLVEHVSYGNNVRGYPKIIKGSEITYLGINRLQTNHLLKHYFSIPPNKLTIHSTTLTKEYRIKVTLNFPFLHGELCVEMPVVIAEEIDENKNSFIQAPSFWQVMNEKH